MKNTLTLLALLLISNASFSQAQRDVVSLKNGSVIKGSIIEQTPPVQLKIETADGNIFVFKYEEIEKIARENFQSPFQTKADEKINFKDYGGKLSLGISMGGGGIAGSTLRFYPARKIAIEVGANLRPSYYTKTTYIYAGNDHPPYEETESSFHLPLMMTAGVHVFLGENYSSWKQRIYRNGLTFTTGKSTIFYRDNFIAFGWSHERFNKARKKYAFESQLGIAAFFYNDKSPLSELDWDTQVIPTLYWKFNWSWFLIK